MVRVMGQGLGLGKLMARFKRSSPILSEGDNALMLVNGSEI